MSREADCPEGRIPPASPRGVAWSEAGFRRVGKAAGAVGLPCPVTGKRCEGRTGKNILPPQEQIQSIQNRERESERWFGKKAFVSTSAHLVGCHLVLCLLSPKVGPRQFLQPLWCCRTFTQLLTAPSALLRWKEPPGIFDPWNSRLWVSRQDAFRGKSGSSLLSSLPRHGGTLVARDKQTGQGTPGKRMAKLRPSRRKRRNHNGPTPGGEGADPIRNASVKGDGQQNTLLPCQSLGEPPGGPRCARAPLPAAAAGATRGEGRSL
ncbi:uncharacterized protein LOC134515837 [Chroicocephalus ridibundus]|uniref:uncharacterized protein LOC134515837 n=1 Tax=Chroicocephalus ridibundus TaxID=1192867 RepID=UPI002FDE2985